LWQIRLTPPWRGLPQDDSEPILKIRKSFFIKRDNDFGGDFFFGRTFHG
jgi:hypothetical protein